jgi:NADPH:quinone reductase-like Zn-dependent oxidoreductase
MVRDTNYPEELSAMRAAVVRSFEHPPCYEQFPAPEAGDGDECVVDVLAAALHPRVRSTGDGTHYESTGELPLIPGIDGVGRTADGERVYFVLPDMLMGSMAERAVVDRRRCAVLPSVGSGQGSVPTREIVAELSALAAHIAEGGYTINVSPTPLSDVADAWTRSIGSSRRIVFIP